MDQRDVFVVAGATGRTGGVVAATLLERGATVRVIVRDPLRGRPWSARGAEVAVCALDDTMGLMTAFSEARGAFVLNPADWAADDPFVDARVIAETVRTAVIGSGLPRLVVLSSIGAHLLHGSGIFRTNHEFEICIRGVPADVTTLRSACFMEDWGEVAALAGAQGLLPSFLAPLERAMPMVSIEDVGRVAAGLLADGIPGRRTIELEGPEPVSPQDVAEAFARALRRPVRAAEILEANWRAVLEGLRASRRTIEALVETFRGFNAARIAFEGGSVPLVRGAVSLDDAVSALVGRTIGAARERCAS